MKTIKKMKSEDIIMLILAIVAGAVIALTNYYIVSAQDPTPTPPPPIIDYVEIQDGEYMAIERTVTVGEMGGFLVGLLLATIFFVYSVYQMVVAKLP